jgi:hypothetical protein
MDRLKAYVLPGAAALLVLSYYAWRWATGVDATEPAATPAATQAESKAAESSKTSASAEPTVRAPAPAAKAPAPTPAPAPDDASRARDRARRDALRQQIEAAQRARTHRKADEPSDPEAVGELPKEYIRERVRDDLIPLALECYTSALEDDEKLAGKLVFQFRIVGEPDVGGIVDDAQIAPESDIQHAELQECMRESLMSMSFDPPENGGAVDVTYPFEFSPDGPPPSEPPPPGAAPPTPPKE